MNYTIPFINVKRIIQEKYYYCGQACMKMFDPNITLSQDELWDLTQKHLEEPNIWYTDPVSIATVLKENSDSMTKINIFSEELTNESLAKSLVSALFSNKPILIPSRGGSHWVISNGVKQNEKGDITGIFIIDPWKGMPGFSFFAFGDFFFDNYFSVITFAGKWARKRIAAVCGSITDKLPINIALQTSLGGGCMYSLDSLSEKDIFEACSFNLDRLGFGSPCEIMAGGFLSEPVTVYDMSTDAIYRIVPLEHNGNIAWSVLNLNNLSVESICFSDELVLYSSDEVKEALTEIMPDKSIEVSKKALFDSKSPCLFSHFDFVYEAKIDGKRCYIKAQDFTILYDLKKLIHPLVGVQTGKQIV